MENGKSNHENNRNKITKDYIDEKEFPKNNVDIHSINSIYCNFGILSFLTII